MMQSIVTVPFSGTLFETPIFFKFWWSSDLYQIRERGMTIIGAFSASFGNQIA